MIEDRRARAPHAVIFAMVVIIVMMLPSFIGDQVEAIKDFISELLSPPGLFLLPLILILVIQFLSSDSGSFVAELFSTGDPNTIHRAGGSSLGFALFLAIVLLFLFSRVSIFGGEDDSEE